MIYRQNFTKLYSWAVFFFASLGLLAAYSILMHGFVWKFDDLALPVVVVAIPVVSLATYRWNFLELRDRKLTKHDLIRKVSVPTESLQSVFFQETPARFLARFSYADESGSSRSFEITTASWSAATLLALTENLRRENTRVQINFDEGTEKKFDKERAQKTAEPKNMLDWIVLTLKYFGSGIAFSVVLLLLLKM